MFQTEFSGSDYKFVISWDSDASHISSTDESIDNNKNLFSKLNELYENISQFTTGQLFIFLLKYEKSIRLFSYESLVIFIEFVDCVKRVPTIDDERVHKIDPNVSFKIENFKNPEAYSDEVFLLRKEVEKLKSQKDQIENDYK